MDEVFLSWPDLNNQPISNQDIEYFTDGSNFVQDGTRFAGYVVVTLDSVIEAPLSLHHQLELHKRLNLSPSHGHSSSLQEYK
jgi:hypothetical protein